MKRLSTEPPIRRASLPLRAADDNDLASLRQSAAGRSAILELTGRSIEVDSSEASILEAVFAAGLAAIKQAVEAEGYAELATQRRSNQSQRKAVARRRQPSWAGEK